MNPEAVEWLESQPITHPFIRAINTGERSDGVTAVRRMVELIDDHETTYDVYEERVLCSRCGANPIVVG